MTVPKLRTLAVAAGLLVAPLAMGTAANAAEPIDVLYYSNALYTDVPEEDATMIAALQAGGGTVTSFDGGDRSGAAWTAALVGVEVLVLPEGIMFDAAVPDSGALSLEAVDVIRAWVQGGGDLFLGYFTMHHQLISALMGLDYSSVWGEDFAEPWTLQIAADLPAELLGANGTDAVDTSPFGPELLAPLTPVYSNGTSVVVGTLTLGSGSILLLGYDWFPAEDDITNGIRQPWDAVLAYYLAQAAPAAAPEPQLAATGDESSTLWIGGVALLFLGAAGIAIARTRSVRA